MSLLSEWDALMKAVEGPYMKAIHREKDRYIHEASHSYRLTGSLVESQLDHHAAAMRGLAETYQGRAIRLGVVKALGKKSIPGLQTKAEWESLWLYLMLKWMTEWGGQRARETAETTRDDIEKIISQAIVIDSNPVYVAEQILKAQGLSAFRAEVIALTEVHNAMMFASQEGAAKVGRDSGVTMLKKWVPVLDERTRISHAAMAGVDPIPLDADFTVGGEKMQRPGDPRASGANTIRCRCVLAYEVVE